MNPFFRSMIFQFLGLFSAPPARETGWNGAVETGKFSLIEGKESNLRLAFFFRIFQPLTILYMNFFRAVDQTHKSMMWNSMKQTIKAVACLYTFLIETSWKPFSFSSCLLSIYDFALLLPSDKFIIIFLYGQQQPRPMYVTEHKKLLELNP